MWNNWFFLITNRKGDSCSGKYTWIKWSNYDYLLIIMHPGCTQAHVACSLCNEALTPMMHMAMLGSLAPLLHYDACLWQMWKCASANIALDLYLYNIDLTTIAEFHRSSQYSFYGSFFECQKFTLLKFYTYLVFLFFFFKVDFLVSQLR